MQNLARFAIRFRWWVIVGWIVFVLAAQAITSALGGAQYRDEFSLPHTETNTVASLLKSANLNSQNSLDGNMVLQSKTGPFTAANPPANVITALEAACSNDQVQGSATPWGIIDCATGGKLVAAGADPKLLSTADPSIALTDISFVGGGRLDQKAVTKLYDQLKQLDSPTLQTQFSGDAFAGLGSSGGSNLPQLLGFLAALIILSIVFRAAGAVALPLASALVALASGLGLIGILTHAMDVSQVTPELTDLMVIGVGVDYALFIITRHRHNLLAGMDIKESIVLAINTSGRAVLFAAVTVCIAMLGLILLGVNFFYGMAIGVAVGVSLTMAASLTLMPALLSFLGLKVLPRRQRRAIKAGTYVASTRVSLWARWAEFVGKQKVLLSIVAAAIIVILAIPFFSIRLGHADQGNDPASSTTRKGYDLISQGFGVGYNSVLSLVVSGPNPQAMADKVAAAVKTVPNVDPASIVVAAKPLTSTVSIVSIKTITSPENVKTTDLVNNLRKNVLPPLYNGTGDRVYVYGQTAVYVDFTNVLAKKLPLFIGAVVILSFLLLMVAFRSLVIPLTAAVMNLFAAGASFGLIVAVFQWGWFSEALGIGKGGPIEAFAPALFFAILFGLSMDYQVFLVSRMHEEWVHTGDNRKAISVGQGQTGGIITAAAIIMICVFGGFLLGDNRVVKLVGLGLASAIFIDAFILRTVLVPALMHLAGKANWYFPKWLEKVTPHLGIEPPEDTMAELDDEPDARTLAPA
jgi:RND superfamily putative drug exporter